MASENYIVVKLPGFDTTLYYSYKMLIGIDGPGVNALVKGSESPSRTTSKHIGMASREMPGNPKRVEKDELKGLLQKAICPCK